MVVIMFDSEADKQNARSARPDDSNSQSRNSTHTQGNVIPTQRNVSQVTRQNNPQVRNTPERTIPMPPSSSSPSTPPRASAARRASGSVKPRDFAWVVIAVAVIAVVAVVGIT